MTPFVLGKDGRIFGEGPKTTYFDIHPHIIHRSNASMTEGLFTEWNYKPKKGLVAGNFMAGFNNWENRIFNKKQRMPIWKANATDTPNETIGPLGRYNTGGQGVEKETATPNIHMLFPFRNPSTTSAILIDDYMFGGNAKVPALCIGLDTLTSAIAVTGGGDKWEPVKCFVDLIVQVECEIELTDGVDYTNPSGFQETLADYMFPEYGIYHSQGRMVKQHPDYQIMGNEVIESIYDSTENTKYDTFSPRPRSTATTPEERSKLGKMKDKEYLSKKPLAHTHYLRSMVEHEKRRSRVQTSSKTAPSKPADNKIN